MWMTWHTFLWIVELRSDKQQGITGVLCYGTSSPKLYKEKKKDKHPILYSQISVFCYLTSVILPPSWPPWPPWSPWSQPLGNFGKVSSMSKGKTTNTLRHRWGAWNVLGAWRSRESRFKRIQYGINHQLTTYGSLVRLLILTSYGDADK